LSGSDGAFIYTTDMMQLHSPAVSPDDDVFRHLATVYASTHPTMHLGQRCNNMDMGFRDGISNGAAWYPLTGEENFISESRYGIMFQDLQTHLLYFKTDKGCHSSRWTQFYCIGKHLFSKLPIHWSETRCFVDTALESAIMNVHNIQEGKDLNYVSVLVNAVDVNLMGKNSSNLQINKNTKIITHNNKVDLGGGGGGKYARFIAGIHDSTKSKYNHFEVIKCIHSF